MNTEHARYLKAARADMIPAGSSGLWSVDKVELPEPVMTLRDGKALCVPAGVITYLRRFTWSGMMSHPPGTVVMEDTDHELRTHLNFIIRARGRVLVTGLGLGCVVRGLLENPAVEHVTCVENSPDVLHLVAPYMPKERLEIVEADALQWQPAGARFDCAWHDLWTCREEGEPHLDAWHLNLMFAWRDRVNFQGAWSFNRAFRRLLRKRARMEIV